MPIFIGLAAAGLLWALTRGQHGTPAAPGPAAYLPPIAAPDWARMAYAQAAASRDPILMASTAQLLVQRGQIELARALSAQYQQMTNQPIPGVPMAAAGGAGPFPHLQAIGAFADPRVLAMCRQLARRRRAMRAARAAHVQGALRAHLLARTA